MKHFRTLIFAFIFTLFFGNVFGQSVSEYREAHRNLLAKQTRVKDKIKVEESHYYAASLYGGPNNYSIYSEGWDNDKFNPYEGNPIAGTTFNVSDYVNPVKTKVVTSHFGYRPRFGRNHYGVDLKASVGDTIYASFDGKVRLAKFNRDGYGFYVIVRHHNGLETLYAHLSKFLVKPNQFVRRGEPIALSGNTGRSTGPHLHYEIRYMGKALNPEKIVNFETHTPISGTFVYNENMTIGKQQVSTASKGNTQNTRKKSKRRR